MYEHCQCLIKLMAICGLCKEEVCGNGRVVANALEAMTQVMVQENEALQAN